MRRFSSLVTFAAGTLFGIVLLARCGSNSAQAGASGPSVYRADCVANGVDTSATVSFDTSSMQGVSVLLCGTDLGASSCIAGFSAAASATGIGAFTIQSSGITVRCNGTADHVTVLVF